MKRLKRIFLDKFRVCVCVCLYIYIYIYIYENYPKLSEDYMNFFDFEYLLYGGDVNCKWFKYSISNDDSYKLPLRNLINLFRKKKLLYL